MLTVPENKPMSWIVTFQNMMPRFVKSFKFTWPRTRVTYLRQMSYVTLTTVYYVCNSLIRIL